MVHGGCGAGVELRAVVHLWFGVLEGDLEDLALLRSILLVLDGGERADTRWETYVGLGGISLGDKTGEETIFVCLAGCLPVALDYTVVLGPEAELDGIAEVRLDVGEAKGQALLADGDDKVGGRGL